MYEADEAYYKEHDESHFSSHMCDFSEEEVQWNISTSAKYLERAMEIGITAGEEEGVDNTSVENSRLYTQPGDILEIHSRLSKISPNFSIAAGFGNAHVKENLPSFCNDPPKFLEWGFAAWPVMLHVLSRRSRLAQLQKQLANHAFRSLCTSKRETASRGKSIVL
jgi:Fructose-bisphosphate aldolase class-II